MRKLFLLLVCGLLQCAGAVPAAAQTIDRPLAERVLAAVRASSHFTIFDDVEVAVAEREVRLTGRVTKAHKQQEIGRLVERLDGVAHVRNDIRVLPPSVHDSQLRQQIARAIYNHPSFWRYASMSHPPIHIIVEHGHVTLTGSVSNEIERSLAYTLAQVPGSASVTNKLKMLYVPSSPGLR
jgi:osmotically-inducible protein OsmY